MSDGFTIEIEDFAALAPKFVQAGDDLGGTTTRQSSVLAGLGAFGASSPSS